MNNNEIEIKKAISLFSGAGGDTLGMERGGVEVVAFSEFDKSAIATHKYNFPNSKLIGEKYNGDITKTPIEEFLKYREKIDIIFAGFPCQGFSKAGKKDKNDKRNELFKYFVDVVNIIKPRFIIGENVKGLLSFNNIEGRSYADLIVEEFEKIGYEMEKPLLLSLDKYGVLQKRERVFFIGQLKDKDYKKIKIDLTKFSNFQYSETFPNLERHLDGAVEINLEYFPFLKEAKDKNQITSVYALYSEPFGVVHPFLLSKIKSKEISFDVRKSPNYISVIDTLKPVKTISCSYSFQPRQVVLMRHNEKYFIRTFSINELKAFQGFNGSFKFIGTKNEQIKQIGNAVPPQIVKFLVEQLLN